MKTSFIVRMVLATIVVTVACVGLLARVTGAAVLLSVPWILLMGVSGLTRPIPREELRMTLFVTGIIVAMLLAIPFLHLSPMRDLGSYPVFVAILWVLWMFAIYRRWRTETRNIGGETDPSV